MKRWALPRYVSSQFVRMVVACVFGLVLAYFIIDIFDNLKWFNQYGATAAEIGRYYSARLPVLAARIVPMALLIAVALTISLIGANGELLGMRACGIPVFRVLAPVWLICGLAVPADHLLANEIVPRASEEASRLKQTEIKNREVDLVLNTPLGKVEREDDVSIRSAAILGGIPCVTTRAGISALISALEALHRGEYQVRRLQDYHGQIPEAVEQERARVRAT